MKKIIACVQMDTGSDIDKNVIKSIKYIKQAKSKKAELIVFPENFIYIGKNKNFHLTLDSHTIKTFRAQAVENQIAIAGCFPIFHKGRVYNQALMINPKGEIIAQYSKIHLFKAKLKNGDSYDETKRIARGYSLTTVEYQHIKYGLSICFDLRFPVLYRKMAMQGIKVALIPSNFTKHTGQAHWVPLLRARAIENQIYVIAPNQCGRKEDKKISYGYSAIVDPWGDFIALKKRGEGIISATIDMNRIDKVRKQLPTIENSRENSFLR